MEAAKTAAFTAAFAAVNAASQLPSIAAVRSSVRSSITSTLDRIQQEAPSSLSSTLHLSSLNQHVKDGTVVHHTLQRIEGLAHRASEAVQHYTHNTNEPPHTGTAATASHKRRHADERKKKGGGVDARPRRIVADRDDAVGGGEKKRRGKAADALSLSASQPSSPLSALSTPASAGPSSASAPLSPMPTSAPSSAPASPLPAKPPAPSFDVTEWPTMSPADLLQDLLALLSPPPPPLPSSASSALFTPLAVPPPSLFTLPLSSPYREYADLHAAYLEVARAMDEQEAEYTAIYDAIQHDRSEAERERRDMMGEDAVRADQVREREDEDRRAARDDGQQETLTRSMAAHVIR